VTLSISRKIKLSAPVSYAEDKIFWIAESTLILLRCFTSKIHGEISTSFGTFDSLKCSLQNVKISQNQNFESLKLTKKYFNVHFDQYFQESTLFSKYVNS